MAKMKSIQSPIKTFRTKKSKRKMGSWPGKQKSIRTTSKYRDTPSGKIKNEMLLSSPVKHTTYILYTVRSLTLRQKGEATYNSVHTRQVIKLRGVSNCHQISRSWTILANRSPGSWTLGSTNQKQVPEVNWCQFKWMGWWQRTISQSRDDMQWWGGRMNQ